VSLRSEQGRLAEDQALGFLQQAGLKLIARNFHSRYGEIDLIMEDGRTLVFVEVRYRSSDRYGSAEESVNHRKQARLVLTAASFLKEKRLNRPTRFDVAALSPGPEGLSVAWIKGAFQSE
jgi:putative endonuclease